MNGRGCRHGGALGRNLGVFLLISHRIKFEVCRIMLLMSWINWIWNHITIGFSHGLADFLSNMRPDCCLIKGLKKQIQKNNGVPPPSGNLTQPHPGWLARHRWPIPVNPSFFFTLERTKTCSLPSQGWFHGKILCVFGLAYWPPNRTERAWQRLHATFAMEMCREKSSPKHQGLLHWGGGQREERRQRAAGFWAGRCRWRFSLGGSVIHSWLEADELRYKG